MNQGRSTRISFIAMLALPACKDEPAKPSVNPDPTKASVDHVAKVNDVFITKAAFAQEFERKGRLLLSETAIKDQALKHLVDEELIRQKAKQLGVTVTPEQVAQKFDEHKRQGLRGFANAPKGIEGWLRHSIAMRLMSQRVMEKMTPDCAVTDAELQQYFNENNDRFTQQQEQVRARHILAMVGVMPPPSGTVVTEEQEQKALKEAKTKARIKIVAAQKKLKKGAKFEEVAREMSDDPVSKLVGGDLGFFTARTMDREMVEAAFKQKVGTVSDIVETSDGFHLIKVEEHRAARKVGFAEVKESIRATLLEQKRTESRGEIMRKLEDAANIVVYAKFDVAPEVGNATP